jgi:cytochrome c oxidase subunit II
MQRLLPALLLAVPILCVLPGVAPADDVEAGKKAYMMCAPCHGPQAAGIHAVNSPALAGQQAAYLVQQLENFRDGVRGADERDPHGMAMAPLATTLATDEVMADVAAYLASLPVATPAATVQGDASRGQTLYNGCAACHGAQGEGKPNVNGPALRGQSDWYLLRQLGRFTGSVRGANDTDVHGAKMKSTAAMLPGEPDASDVVAYIQTL